MGLFRSFLARCRSFLARSMPFQVVPCFTRYLRCYVIFQWRASCKRKSLVFINLYFLKIGFLSFKKVRFICFIENSLKMMKNAFCSSKNLSLVLRYLNFCPDVFEHVGKRLDKNAKINLKTYDVTSWETNY